jgi:PAS domain S-box-containing protein
LSREELEAALREARLERAELELRNEQLSSVQAEFTHQAEFVRTLLDSIPVMVAIYDPRLRSFQLNRQLRETLGWTNEDATHPGFLERVYPDPETRHEVQRFMRNLEPGWRDFPARAKDGTIVEATWANVGLTDETRIGIGVDIRERKLREGQLTRLNARLAEHVAQRSGELQHSFVQLEAESLRRERAERALHHRSRLLEAFFEHSMSPLVFLSRDLEVLRVNAAFASAMQTSREELVGQRFESLAIDQPDVSVLDAVLHTGRSKRRAAQRFVKLRHEDGGATYWNWALVPLREADGTVSELVLTLEDVTDQTRTREELEAANAELSRVADQLRSLTMELAEAEDRERKRLAEVLHDDLQQMLTGARYQLGALSRRVEDDGDSRQAIERIEGLIEQSAAKARTLSHELRPAVLEQSDLGPALEWLAKDLEQKQGLTVRLDLERAEAPELSPGLKVFLYKAVRELLFNVVKHARRSEADLRLRYGAGRLELDVIDAGDGFETDALARPGLDGTGFGLFGIRERLQLLGGRLVVDSVPNSGTRVTIIVPRSREASAAQVASSLAGGDPTPAAVGDDSHGDATRVLVVDDHPEARSGVIALLGDDPALRVVGEAVNGRHAIEMARELRPQLVLMDVAMPVLDGISATEVIKRERPGAAVIGLSMYDDDDLRRRMLGAGAEAFLSKSDDPADLLAAIRTAVKGEGEPDAS